MKTEFETPRTGQDSGLTLYDAQQGDAAIPFIPGNGADAGHPVRETHPLAASIHNSGASRALAAEAATPQGQLQIAASAAMPGQPGGDRAKNAPQPSLPAPDPTPIPRKRGRPAIRTLKATCIAPVAADAPSGAQEAIPDAEPKELPPPAKTRRKAVDGRGRTRDEPHRHLAPSVTPLRRRSCGEPQTTIAAERGPGHLLGDTHKHPAGAAPIIAEVRMLYRRRVQWHRAEKRLTLQCGAICRAFVPDGDKELAGKLLARIEKGKTALDEINAEIACAPLLAARALLRTERLAVEKTLEKLAKQLPAFSYVESVRGFGALSFAQIVGECGDIGSYKSVSALWKRMGLAVIEGGRQRRVAGDAALDHGYSPERRSIMWNVASCMLKAQRPDDPFRVYYDAEKAKQIAKLAEGLLDGKEPSKAHAHNRACRHMSKRLLRDLFAAWRREATSRLEPSEATPPAEPIPERSGAESQRLAEAHSSRALGNQARKGGRKSIARLQPSEEATSGTIPDPAHAGGGGQMRSEVQSRIAPAHSNASASAPAKPKGGSRLRAGAQ